VWRCLIQFIADKILLTLNLDEDHLFFVPRGSQWREYRESVVYLL
jgi:hypothetical protein